MSKFLEWWVLFLLQMAGLGVCQYFGLFEWVWAKDVTKLAYVSLLAWFVTSIYCGNLSWKLSKNEFGPRDVEQFSDRGWFVSDLCFSLGLLGTVIGFLVLMSGINMASATDPAAAQAMLKTMSTGMSTAMITTAVGIITGNLLKIQFFLLNR